MQPEIIKGSWQQTVFPIFIAGEDCLSLELAS